MKCRKKAFIAFMMTACIVSTHTALALDASLEEILSALEERQELTQKESAEKESNKESSLVNLFVEFGIQIREASFRQIDSAVSSFDGYCERTVPTNTEFGEHKLIDDNGFELTMAYMPIDSSFDSKDFGNIDKEMLYSVSLSHGDNSITMSNSMHTQEIEFSTYSADRSSPNKTVNSIDELLNFFENEMNGFVPESLRGVHLSPSMSQQIKTTIEYRSKEYTDCQVTDITVNIETNSDPIQHIVLVYCEYARNNSLDTTREMIDIYSDDIAAYLAQKHDSVSEVYVFWTVPKYYANNIAAKCSYNIHDAKAFIADKFGDLYQK